MKRICFDLRALQIGHENRGIGMYTKSVLEHIPKNNNEYIIFAYETGDPIQDLKINFLNDYKLVQMPSKKRSLDSPSDVLNIFSHLSPSFTHLKPYKPDVFVQFDFGLGIPAWKSTKKIVVAYDLIPLILKNEYLPGVSFAWSHSIGKKAKLRAVLRSIYYRVKYKLGYRTYKMADQVLSISEATRKSFIELLNIAPDKIRTIPLAPVLPEGAADYSISNRIKKPYIFYIGGTDTRKRPADIVKAFNIARSRGTDIALVFAGNEFKHLDDLPNIEARKAIIDSPYKNDIYLVGFINDAQKAGLYKKALAFIFCSSYEGFGLPVIESMAMGCPVIAYNNSSIPEAAGEAAILVPTRDYLEVARNIIHLREESKMHDKFAALGKTQALKFTWDEYINKFDRVV